MLDDIQNYSLEPDWMLQSSQVSDSSLICELVKSYYPGLHRLAFALLEDAEKAGIVSEKAIRWGVANRHRFWGSTSLRAWLYAWVYKACGRVNLKSRIRQGSSKPMRNLFEERVVRLPLASVDTPLGETLARLDRQDLILLALDALDECNPSEIARILGGRSRAASIGLRITSLRQRLTAAAPLEGISEAENKTRLIHLLQAAFPLRVPTGEEEAGLCAHIEAQLSKGWKGEKLPLGAKELALGGLLVALVIGLALVSNMMAPNPYPAFYSGDRQGTSAAYNGIFVTPPSSAFGVFFLSTDFPSSEMFTPTPVTPRTSQKPLTLQSSLQDIKARMEGTDYYWSTLYAEALIVDYGPPGYIGPPNLYRNRLWFSQPAHMMVLAGPPNQAPDYARIVIDNNYFEEDMKSGVAYYPKSIDLINSQRASSVILGYALSYADRNRLYGYYLSDMLFPFNAISNATQIELAGQDNFNGRAALVLRWMRKDQKAQVWVDALTGLILGWRLYLPGSENLVARDIFLTSLALDINFPARMYSYRPVMSDKASWEDVWTPSADLATLRTEGEVLNAPYGRVMVESAPAPAGYNPNDAPLSFQWQTNPDGSISAKASLISSRYDLGTVNMGDPWSLLCVRSPDGSMITVIQRPDIPFYAPNSVIWFRLKEPSKVYSLFSDGYTASDVAYSPDSQWLAFFACTTIESNCGVYILNTQTQQSRKLMNIGTGAYFAWSPDGQDLAMLGTDDLGSLRVFIINVNNGEIVYTGPIDWRTFTTASDSPTRSWGVPFPTSPGGLEACVSAPKP